MASEVSIGEEGAATALIRECRARREAQQQVT
jgi:hypothetical protein